MSREPHSENEKNKMDVRDLWQNENKIPTIKTNTAF